MGGEDNNHNTTQKAAPALPVFSIEEIFFMTPRPLF